MIDESLWRADQLPLFPARTLPSHVDVVVIGGGITGMTAAYLLKQSGKTVAVLERYQIGAGDTGNTSAHVTNITDAGLSEMTKQFGKDVARRVWEGNAAAIDLIESNIMKLGIDAQFQRVPGFVCSPFRSERDETDYLREEAALAVELGFPARYLEQGPITGRPALSVADQAVFHPLRYIAGLARAVDGDGSIVCELSEVTEVQQDPLAVKVNGHTLECGDVVIATHMPITGSSGLLSSMLFHTKLYPYSTYVMSGPLTDTSIAPGSYNDLADPYYYLRVHDTGTGRYAIFGGCDHKTGQESDTETRFAELETAFREVVPSAIIERRWSGRVIETDDGLPFIGETAPHQYAATGYTGNGMTFGTLAGMMMHDFVLGVNNPWREVFDPDRKAKTAGAVTTYIAENLDFPYYFIADRLRRSRTGGVDEVQPGQGKVLMLDGKRVACHRTESGEVMKVSAVCTHMGCLVRWNDAERTWDCPCHGSRFTPDGLVIGGPAETPLERID